MNRLLKSVKSSISHHDNIDLIKVSIVKQLSDSVKEIQYSSVEENATANNVTESAHTLCTTIEALFLHGLKDSFTHKFKKAIADVDEAPEPNFWAPLLVISHRQIIDQVTSLSQITTEVGQCRAWIRLILNDCLLSSYLMILRQDKSLLKSFYNVGAYVRDTELLELSQTLIEGVETCSQTFTLPCNSSLLNTWPLPSLFLAGIWSSTLKACPVAPCDDVAQILDDERRTTKPQFISGASSETVSLHSAVSLTSQNSSLRPIGMMTEDAVLKMILNENNGTITEGREAGEVKPSAVCSSGSENAAFANVHYGNSLVRDTGWSFDDDCEENVVNHEKCKENHEESKSNAPEKAVNSEMMRSTEASYNALIESYNMLSAGSGPLDVWQKFEDERNTDASIKFDNNNIESAREFVTTNGSISLDKQLGKLAHEKGLDCQNYQCFTCNQELNLSHNMNLCHFTGEYCCDNCMSSQSIPIPAKIVHNWDFKPYPVSEKSYNYLNEIKYNAVIDLKMLNPHIYEVVDSMAQLQSLRNQLNFLRAYLYTCREPIIEQLQKLICAKEYMYEHIHLYSFADLCEIQSGILVQHLQKVVEFGKEHVFGCWLCSQKGFVCEICNKPKPLFPFDIENNYRCANCNAVYHKNCLNASKPCPKCDRRKRREDLPLLGALIND